MYKSMNSTYNKKFRLIFAAVRFADMKYIYLVIAIFLSSHTFGQLSIPQQETVLKNLNYIRNKGCRCGGKKYAPVSPLRLDEKLTAVAQIYAEEISAKQKLSHIGKNGSKAGDRIKRGGYNWSYYGENIAGGYRTVSEVIKAWLDSPSHCRTLMNPNYIHIGIGFRDEYWVTDFGSPKSKL
jgi:uncharacterized protein YkwD